MFFGFELSNFTLRQKILVLIICAAAVIIIRLVVSGDESVGADKSLAEYAVGFILYIFLSLPALAVCLFLQKVLDSREADKEDTK